MIVPPIIVCLRADLFHLYEAWFDVTLDSSHLDFSTVIPQWTIDDLNRPVLGYHQL